jgi:hypothetical protein
VGVGVGSESAGGLGGSRVLGGVGGRSVVEDILLVAAHQVPSCYQCLGIGVTGGVVRMVEGLRGGGGA